MTTIHFLTDWALRSSILILTGALLFRALRVKDASIGLAAWTAMLFGSLVLPALTTVLPSIPLTLTSAAPQRLEVPKAAQEATPLLVRETPRQKAATAENRFDWVRVSLGVYVLVACGLLVRLCVGLLMSRRLLRSSRATGRMTEGIEIRESQGIAAPVTLGILRSTIVIPIDWHEWNDAKLEAVVAHERSHIRRRDPAVQLFSAIHRALLWHSPLSWFLHQRIVQLAEEASDDAVVALTRDRESYAELLLEFMQRGVRGANWHSAIWPGENWHGVAMARHCKPAERISRILDGATLSHGVTRWSILAILACGSPLAYVVAAAQTRVAQTQMMSIAPVAANARMGAVSGVRVAVEPAVAALEQAATQAPNGTATPAQAATPRPSRSIRRYMVVSGDSTSGSWDSSESPDQQELRQRFGEHFAWFRQGSSEYVVTDAGVLAQLEAAMAPQREVNRMQDAVNKQQEVINQHQENVDRSQSAVNAIQDAANRRQELINELQSAKGDDELMRRLEATLAELRARKGETKDQDTANREQARVNELQAHVNEEQGKVNEQQHKVNEEQNRVSGQYEGRIREILDSAVRRHLTQELK
jgi:beta-lactamase regulating signal transducer with metallopeptidase domain